MNLLSLFIFARSLVLLMVRSLIYFLLSKFLVKFLSFISSSGRAKKC